MHVGDIGYRRSRRYPRLREPSLHVRHTLTAMHARSCRSHFYAALMTLSLASVSKIGTALATSRTPKITSGMLDAQRLKAEFERDGQLRSHLQKYVLANLIQSAQNAACNRRHTINERLGRWLFTCHDRVQFDRMPLTHEFLGQMLGAPRTTVTLAAGILHEAGLIDYT